MNILLPPLMELFEDVSKICAKNVKIGRNYVTPTKEYWNVHYDSIIPTALVMDEGSRVIKKNHGDGKEKGAIKGEGEGDDAILKPGGDNGNKWNNLNQKELFVISSKLVVAWDKTYDATGRTFNIEFYEETTKSRVGSNAMLSKGQSSSASIKSVMSMMSFIATLENLIEKLIKKVIRMIKRTGGRDINYFETTPITLNFGGGIKGGMLGENDRDTDEDGNGNGNGDGNENENEIGNIVTRKKDIHGGGELSLRLGTFKTYPSKSMSVRFYNVRTDQIRVFDDDCREMSLDDIVRGDDVKIMFHIRSIWLSKDHKWGVNLQLVQIMRIRPYENIHKKMIMGKLRHMETYGMNDTNGLGMGAEAMGAAAMGAAPEMGHMVDIKSSIVMKYKKMRTIGLPAEAIRQRISTDFDLKAPQKDHLMRLLGLLKSGDNSGGMRMVVSNSNSPPPLLSNVIPPPPLKNEDGVVHNQSIQKKKVSNLEGIVGAFRPSRSMLLAAKSKLKKIITG